jgi:ATP synthase protein I
MGEQQRASIPRPPVHRITFAQLLALAPVLGVPWFFWPKLAIAGLAGAMIEVLARAYFGFYAFRYTGALQMRQVVRSFRRGELGKFMLVAVSFGALFALDKNLHPAAVFIGYLVAWLLGTIFSMRLLK